MQIKSTISAIDANTMAVITTGLWFFLARLTMMSTHATTSITVPIQNITIQLVQVSFTSLSDAVYSSMEVLFVTNRRIILRIAKIRPVIAAPFPLLMTVPRPLHAGHSRICVIMPKSVCICCWTRPAPLQTGHISGCGIGAGCGCATGCGIGAGCGCAGCCGAGCAKPCWFIGCCVMGCCGIGAAWYGIG